MRPTIDTQSTWDTIFRSREWGRYPPEYVVRFIARNFYQVPRRRKIRLLDLGCGPGACAWFMAREGFNVSGIDGSPTAIKLASGRLRRENISADFRVGDYTDLPWPDSVFDGVVENVTLCCNPFDKCRRAVDEVLRVLKPGGRFLSANFTDRTWGYGSGRPVGPSTFKNVKRGPLKDQGTILFMNRSHLDLLYEGFDAVAVERVSWTMENMQHLVELWVACCTK